MTSVGKQLCLVVGNPRGFTRSVVEALLKRGSKVVLTCSNQSQALEQHKRLSGLYGTGQISYTPCDHTNETELESVMIKTLDTHGDINLIVHSTANDPLRLTSQQISGDVRRINRKLDRYLIKNDVDGLKRLGKLATKYMGKHNGGQGGNLLNISSSTEVTPGVEPGSGQCTVLGTTRSFGLVSGVERTGVRVTNVYHPSVDYTELRWQAQITDDQHSPYTGGYNDKYSCYLREYIGYMAIHIAETGPPGSGWFFSDQFRLKQVSPGDIQTCCGIANKMCYWLGCPMVTDDVTDIGHLARPAPVNRDHVNTADHEIQTGELYDR